MLDSYYVVLEYTLTILILKMAMFKKLVYIQSFLTSRLT